MAEASKVYICSCGGLIKQTHVDDVGTVWFKCDTCGRTASFTELERNRAKSLETLKKEHEELNKPLTVDDVIQILGSTIKHDDQNKAITFLTMLNTFTEEDQINIGFLAESSTGKSYIPLELSAYFPQEDVLKLGYASPTAFFHEWGKVETDTEGKKTIHVNLHQKILIFLDQPHDQLLQRLRSLLSHDEKEIALKITDRREKAGLRTKTVIVEGYPTVIFCSAKFTMQDQEKTRLLLLSPEISQEKLRESIALKIDKESDREAFLNRLMDNPQRKILSTRVWALKREEVKNVKIPEEYREQIYRQFMEDHKALTPRLQRDITRLLAIIKGHSLLNFMHRKRNEGSITVNLEDVEAGFRLYYFVSIPNEYGLPPEIYRIFESLKPFLEDKESGINRKDFQQWYYKKYFKVIGRDRATDILKILDSTGLIVEQPNPIDKRVINYVLPDMGVNSNSGVVEGVTPHSGNTLFSKEREVH